ncbi:MAG: hypothetical protein JJE48_02050 [Actinobacteria bacterium]|nr:hypothetical protein [Actinomycetota bacterium]
MSFLRTLGSYMAKMGSNKELMTGLMEGLDPRVVAEAINENAGIMGNIMANLDPKAIADSMNESMQVMGEVIKYIDPKAMAEMVNKNERILPRFVERINPNVFTRSAGTVFSKMRYATYRPSMFQSAGEPSEE